MNLIPTKLPTVGALLLGLTASLQAQTAPAPSPATTPPPSDEVITLSEFTVSETSNRGYVASETMTGSRVATPIIDLPYQVNVLTTEFFEDFAMYELGDNITQIGSFTGLDIGGGFTLRGFGSTSQLRDGFYRLGRYGGSNIDRMEIIKGSNAAIYGRTSPGGMVNMISKQPKDREYYSLRLNYGDYRTRRATLETTGPFIPSVFGKTSYIFVASFLERGFDQPFALNRNEEYYLAVKHKFNDGSTFFISGEHFHQQRKSPPSSAPVIIDQRGTAATTDDIAIGYAKPLAGLNPSGMNSELNRGNRSVTAVYDKRFSPMWSTRIGANYYEARRWDYNAGGWPNPININTVAGTITADRGATPTKGLIFEDGGGIQADLLAQYKLFNDRVSNRTLFTIDINDYYRWDPTWNYGAASLPELVAWNTARRVTFDSNFRPTAPIQYFPNWFRWGQETRNRLTKRRATSYGGLLRHQASFFNDRLLTFAGARFDRVRFRHRDWTAAVSQFSSIPGYVQGQMIDRTVNELKPNAGFNYKITPQLRFFVNYSESYFVNQTENANVIASPSYKSEVADGWDYGFKGAFFQDKLHFTVSGFYANRHNVRVTDVDFDAAGNPFTVTRADGDQLVRGYEADLSYIVTPDLSVTASYGNVYSIYTDFGSESPLAVGRRVNGVTPENGSVLVKWAPAAGALKGFSTNIGVSHISATPSEGPNQGDVYANIGGQRVLTSSTRRWALRTPAFTTVDFGIRYRFKSGSNVDHEIGMNINNLLDEDYLKTNRQLGDRRGFYFQYKIGFAGDNR